MAQFTEIIEELDDCFLKTAANIAKHYVDENEQEKMLSKLRNILRDNCIETTKMKDADDIKDRYIMEYESETNPEDILEQYRKAISEIQTDPSENDRLARYDQQIAELHQMNHATSSKTLDDTDADLRLTRQDVNIIDPISKTRMIDPVKNAVCGHVYDRANLVAMLQRNNKTRCPVVGCSNKDYIDLSQCRTDIVTKMYLEKNPA